MVKASDNTVFMPTPEELFRYSTIEAIVEDVDNNHFLLPPEIRNVAPPAGYSSPKVRELLYRLVCLNTINMTYLEIGVHTGSTFFAATYKNDSRAVAIDNWSLSTDMGPPGGAKNAFLQGMAKITGVPFDRRRISVVEADAFSVDISKIPTPVTVYFYDGDHSREAQYNALTYYAPVLADHFVFIVDDFNWAEPREETYHALKDLKYRIVHEWRLKAKTDRDMVDWWNGLFVGIIKKG